MSDIYELHSKAFDRVSAFVILRDGEKVATVSIKYPADGAARLYAYVHWIGLRMVRGMATGFGYDKRSAAVGDALGHLKADNPPSGVETEGAMRFAEFCDCRAAMDGLDWTRAIERAGFVVMQAV